MEEETTDGEGAQHREQLHKEVEAIMADVFGELEVSNLLL